VDLPAVSPGATPAWLRGLLRDTDLLLLLVDLDTDPSADLQQLLAELGALRLEPCPPEAVALEEGGGGGGEGLQRRRALVVGTRLDLPAAEDGAELLELELDGRLPLLRASAVARAGLDELRWRIVEALALVRVYAKPPGRPADLRRPFVLPRGSTVEDLADTVHHELRQKLHYAVRWPSDAAPMRVGHQYELRDRDVIELHAG
jgi:ribosome-interacting GTPase 1